MAKLKFFPLATNSVKGVTSVVSGLKQATAGTIESVRATDTCYVSANGSDSLGDGSETNPLATLSAALTLLGSGLQGKTIYVGPGTFTLVPLPSPNTFIVGAGREATTLTLPGGGWTEVVSGVRSFTDLTISGDISGKNGGDLTCNFLRCSIAGTHTLVGSGVYEHVSAFPAFVNSTPTILNPDLKLSPPLSFSMNSGVATNGSTPAIQVFGGNWGTITLTDAVGDKPLQISAIASAVVAQNKASVEVLPNSICSSFSAQDLTSVVLDRTPYAVGKSYTGLGKFFWAQVKLKKSMNANSGEQDVTLPIPPLVSFSTLSVYGQADLADVDISTVSNTSSTVTVHVKPASPTHSAYTFSLLVVP
jgi:hypothetical protein